MQEAKLKKRFIGKLPQYESYKITKVYHQSLQNSNTIITLCHNCGKAICNIAIVENSKGKKFEVGLDCASTLTNLDNQWEYMQSLEFANDAIKAGKAARTSILNKAKRLHRDVALQVVCKSFINDKNYFKEIGAGGYEIWVKYSSNPVKENWCNFNKEVWQNIVFLYIQDLV